MKSPIGFIGLGLMGRPMAANLLKAGYDVTVWNRTPARADGLVAQGAKRAATPRDVATASEVGFTIVSDPPALASVLWGGDGGCAGVRRGAEFLEAPGTGGTWGAEKGELVFMVGGETETLKRVEPVLSAMGKKWFHLGPHGAGQTVKLAMNLLLALEVEAFAEALALVTRAGLPGERLFEVMQTSMGRSGLLDIKGPMMLKGEYKPSFPLRLMHKDMRLAPDLANQLGVPLPSAAATREVLSSVKGATKEDVDFSALASFWSKS